LVSENNLKGDPKSPFFLSIIEILEGSFYITTI
jgi:hypothetical protein